MTLSGRPKQAILGSKTGHFEPFWAILGSNVLKMACFRPVLEGFLEGPEWVDLGPEWVKYGSKSGQNRPKQLQMAILAPDGSKWPQNPSKQAQNRPKQAKTRYLSRTGLQTLVLGSK